MTPGSRVWISIVLATGACYALGSIMLLRHVRWFSQRSLSDRIRPFVPHAFVIESKREETRIDSIDAVLKFFGIAADVIARQLGVRDSLELRLAQADMLQTPQEFRIRQLGWTAASGLVVMLACVTLQTTFLIAVFFATVAMCLVFLVIEQLLSQRIANVRDRTFLELPVVAEQVATLLSAGYSLATALRHCSQRNTGSSGAMLRRVLERVKHGVGLNTALREWSDVLQITELQQFVAILSLQHETPDLARLVSEHARVMRNEAQRRRCELIERRSQQVWIPVTVATLIPGVIFLLIPFLQALSLLSGS